MGLWGTHHCGERTGTALWGALGYDGTQHLTAHLLLFIVILLLILLALLVWWWGTLGC